MIRNTLALISFLILGIALLLTPMLATAEDQDDLLILANPSTKATSISLAETREIFLKTRMSFRGNNTLPINAPEGSTLRKVFASKVLGMSPSDEKQYWEKQKIMAGKTPPASFGNTTKAVYKLKNSISYVFRKDYKNVGKILLVIPG